MALFSKKIYVCKRCGKKYEARVTLGLCDDCRMKEEEADERMLRKAEDLKGYMKYARKMAWNPYSDEKQDEIALHRNAILEKYRVTEGITAEELREASDKYKKLSDEEALDIMRRTFNSAVSSTLGAAYTENFFIPAAFEKCVVDVADVFAVGYTTDQRINIDGIDMILCVIFTNDPYMPVFPMCYCAKLGFFERKKSKKARGGLELLFEVRCPNLTYPVQELKQLKKQIKAEGTVEGKMSQKFALQRISEASSGLGIFNSKKLERNLPDSTAAMLGEYGYIQDTHIEKILKMDKMFNRHYWEKQIARFAAAEGIIN